MTRVRDHFRRQASSFDSLYDDEAGLFNRVARRGLFARRELALNAVRSHVTPRVLDIGCGSGRVAELTMEAGARAYVGIDFSEPMLKLAGARLARFGEAATLVQGDFLTTDISGSFDVILALGLFDYIETPHAFVRRMFEVCAPGGSVVASFPRWHWLKGPIRYVRYQVINSCPIYDYTDRELRFLFLGAGFAQVSIDEMPSGFMLRAER